ncbi:WD40-repeat-containing domain protein [Xylariaceae sp. FL1019]|nr:WD40-repeat-containing domain protein [Xylariaceae sp. FL1019]
MQVQQGDVPVYTVAGAETARPLPEWLARRRKRSLKADAEYQNRIEVLQDFSFEEASSCVRISEDNDWIMSTGTYKPQIHVHYLPHLSLSYARHTTSLNITFTLLGRDASKSLHLQSDRRIEFHTPAGLLETMRLPRYGRDLVFDRLATEALIPAVGLGSEGSGEVFRVNLESGRFLQPYKIDVGADSGDEVGLQGSSKSAHDSDFKRGLGSRAGFTHRALLMTNLVTAPAVNVAAIGENTHNLLAFGTSIGSVEFWDSRSRSRIAILGGQEGEITALDFSDSGLSLCTGSSTGVIKLFDMRSPRPLLQKDHGSGFPIKNLTHMTTSSSERKIMSSDKQLIKIFDESTGETWTSIEPTVDINFTTWVKGTGMILTANEGSAQHAFLIPQLGNAPRWASHLDSLTEEMASEVTTTNYDNYKFLTLAELRSLSMDHLIGKTSLLRPYMHGYFVASKLYEQARLIANPFAFDEERAKRVKEKVEKERASRIRGNKKVKVNQNLVDKLLQRQQRRAEVDTKAGILGDDRFSRMFENEEFQIDENSFEFRSLNPSTRVDPESGRPITSTARAPSDESDNNSSSSDDSDSDSPPPKEKGDSVKMHISSSNQKGRLSERDTAFGSRTHKQTRTTRPKGGDVAGEKEVTFVPESRKKKSQMEESADFAPEPKRKDARRSASSNVLRGL